MNNLLKLNNSGFYCVLKGFGISIILSLICIFVYAVVLVNTDIQESTIKPVVITITGVCVLIGSSISSLSIKKNGIINGICVGALYFFSLYLLSSIAFCGFYFNFTSAIMIFVGMFLGALGGIIGVNFHK